MTPSFGYSLVPEKIHLLGHAGLTYLDSENKYFDPKLAFTVGASLDWQISGSKKGQLYQAIELSAFFIEETGSAGISSSMPISGSIEDMLCSNSFSQTKCQERGVAPAAYVFALQYKIGLSR